MEQNWYNKIDAFLDGLLSPEDRRDMENAMAQDAALARAVRLNTLQRQAMDILKDKKTKQEFLDWTTPPPPAPSLYRRYLPLFAVLLLLLLSGLFVWMFRSSDTGASSSEMPRQSIPPSSPADSIVKRNPKAVVENSTEKKTEKHPVAIDTKRRDHANTALAAVYAEEAGSMFDANISVFRGADDSTPDQQLFTDALQAYENAMNEADYQQVVVLLNQIKATGKLGIDVTYLKGYALFKARRFEAAADAFAAVATSGAYSKEPKWKEALSLYAAGATQKVRLMAVLEEVISGSFPKAKKDQAKSMMEKLR